ncbi:hypothetical protein GF327_06605 [Candidatus Woesearchaeota archaeon]|nr:hypothetical protein [Candidatus Woesearchaeota archaeon]
MKLIKQSLDIEFESLFLIEKRIKERKKIRRKKIQKNSEKLILPERFNNKLKCNFTKNNNCRIIMNKQKKKSYYSAA